MFNKINKIYVPVLVIIVFGLQTILSSPEIYAQNRVFADVPGSGGGTTGQSQDTGGSSSTLLIVGGVIIAGLLFYKLVIDKDEPKKDEKSDSTSNQSILLKNNIYIQNQNTVLKEVQPLPINLYVGIQKIDSALREKRFIMGISCNF